MKKLYAGRIVNYRGCMKKKKKKKNMSSQISRDLHSDCFAMVLTAGFYCDSWAHNVRKVRVVKFKYIVVYGQIEAADQKYCHNQKWRRKLNEISFRTRGFWNNLDDFGRDIVEQRYGI